jgi:arylsulfatase A-like enzyme
MDWGVGQVFDTLRKLKLDQNTFVLFTSDNGGTPRSVNTPLRGNKASTWEGGVRVPTIAWWPGKIPAGTESDGIFAMFDVLPTLTALAGGKPPTDRKYDGVNIWPQLIGEKDAKPAHDSFLYYRGLQLEAVRLGDWKLQINNPAKKADAKEEAFTPRLYDLKNDIGETKDVAAANPEVVKKLQALIESLKSDLGINGTGPGCRALGKVKNPQPLISLDGKIRSGFEPKK